MEQFDITAWVFASPEVCKREQISPNRLGYKASSGTLAVFVRRASRGDCAFSKGGLDYLDKALALGVRGDGSPVREAIVICTEADDKPFKQYSAEEMHNRFDGVEPWPGRFGDGPYWWIKTDNDDDDWKM